MIPTLTPLAPLARSCLRHIKKMINGKIISLSHFPDSAQSVPVWAYMQSSILVDTMPYEDTLPYEDSDSETADWPSQQYLTWQGRDVARLVPLLPKLKGLRIYGACEIDGETWHSVLQQAAELDALTLCYWRLRGTELPATLRTLRTLKLSNCIIEGELPALPQLEDLTIDGGLTDELLRPLTSLTRLNARRRAAALSDDALRGLTRLRSLTLWRPSILVGDAFAALTDLQSLNISGCSVQALNSALEHLPQLTRLVALDILQPVSVVAVHPSLALRTELQVLQIGPEDLPGNGVLMVPDEHLMRLTGLRDLALMNTTGCSEWGPLLAGLRHLTKLEVYESDGLWGGPIPSLSSLHSLSVHGCPTLTDATFDSLSSLSSLSVSACTRLTDAALTPLTSLQELCVPVPPRAHRQYKKLPFSDAAIARIQTLNKFITVFPLAQEVQAELLQRLGWNYVW